MSEEMPEPGKELPVDPEPVVPTDPAGGQESGGSGPAEKAPADPALPVLAGSEGGRSSGVPVPGEDAPPDIVQPSDGQQPGASGPVDHIPEETGHPDMAGQPGKQSPVEPVPIEPVESGPAVEPPAAEQPAVEDPVEILVGMAERGEIDPWNINIIEVTDRFLNELERCRQLNLRVSGRTLFYAATLLRMKSEHLADTSTQDGGDTEGGDTDFGDDFDLVLDSEFAYEGRLGPIERLEREIQRRLDRKNMRKSPVTLFELIIELKNIEKEERRRRRLSESEPPLLDADDVVGIAHDEGYQDSATTVFQECLKCIVRKEEMTLAELCRKLGWTIPEVYIPLLFLMLDGQCALRQDEFFGEIYVQVCRAGDSSDKALQEST